MNNNKTDLHVAFIAIASCALRSIFLLCLGCFPSLSLAVQFDDDGMPLTTSPATTNKPAEDKPGTVNAVKKNDPASPDNDGLKKKTNELKAKEARRKEQQKKDREVQKSQQDAQEQVRSSPETNGNKKNHPTDTIESGVKAAVKKPAGQSFRDCDDCPEMQIVSPGKFRMGLPEGTGAGDEHPQLTVNITYKFAVSQRKITYGEWGACIKAGSCARLAGKSINTINRSLPYNELSWQDAQTYMAWLSLKTRKKYRLPSEAEWEYIASSIVVDKGANESGCLQGRYCEDGYVVINESKNAFGVQDMATGGILEWVQDCYRPGYQPILSTGKAWEASCGNLDARVLRGGLQNASSRDRSRMKARPDVRKKEFGLRVVREM